MIHEIRLGVNIDHVATLREVRKVRYPNLVEAMHLAERGGADQITVHLREDRRHIQEQDVISLLDASLLPINMEMALTAEMIRMACRWKPFSVTLVPEKREEMTTESGLDLKRIKNRRKELHKLQSKVYVFAFIDPKPNQVKLAREAGFDGVEFHTGPYAHAFERDLRGRQRVFKKEQERLFEAAEEAVEQELEVKAGHGLTVQNVRHLKEMPGLNEVNIGHSIVARSVLMGLEQATREMKQALL